jgi:Helix-turn-helix.
LQKTSIALLMKEINRLKVVLVEQKRTGKWLAVTLGKNEATISRWCTNETQPSLDTLLEIAKVLNVDIKELLVSSKESK